MRGFCVLIATLVVVDVACAADAPVDFNRDVRPILSNHCYACHGPDAESLKGKLALNTRTTALAPAKSGKPAIVPGDPDASELVRRVYHRDADHRMPPVEFKKPLNDVQRDVLRRWVAQGAEFAEHWAFVKPVRSKLPRVSDTNWPVNDVDYFVLAKLDAAGMKPSEPADRATLIRRVSLDLIGLPPTPAEVDAFVADTSADAYENLVDRLLASPRFGEHWARPWLDLARYADSNGFQRDGFREVWAYRDWVIRALNSDMPYDRFTIEQIAGDLLPDATKDQKIATGFHRQVTINVEAGTNPEADRTNQVMDRVNVTGTVLLGLSLECAQCHNHKFDPISQREYYSLLAYFNNTPLESRYLDKSMTGLAFIDAPAIALEGQAGLLARRNRLQAEYDALLESCAQKPLPEQTSQLKALKQVIDAIPVKTSLVMKEMPKPRQTHVMIRGQWNRKGERVEPGVIGALHELPKGAPANRLGLARWLASRENPLTARVAVNRWWSQLFGRGIVATVEDLGTQGAPPTHPELLDWLAVEFMENGWSMKRTLRTVVLSATYRQSSRIEPDALKADPANRLYARAPRLRLSAEAIRDNALAIAGLLSDKMYGEPVMPPQPPKIWRVIGNVDNTYRTSTGEDRYRRGVYTVWRRSAHYPSFANFDAPKRGICVAQRRRTNTPLQALTLLNDEVYVEASRAFAERIRSDNPDNTNIEHRVRYAIRLTLGRPARKGEAEHLAGVVRREYQRYKKNPKLPRPAGTKDPGHAAWFYCATILLNLDETITRP